MVEGRTNGQAVRSRVGTAERLHLRALVRACEDENRRWAAGDRNHAVDEDFSRELFRRAVCERDAAAWEALFTLYRGLVATWVRQHPASERVPTREDCVNLVFERFWGAVGAERFDEFPSAAALLKYLKMCVHTVLIDEVRAQRAAQRALSAWPADEQITAGVEAVPVALADAELWQAVTREVQDGVERLLLYLSAALDLSPRQIHARYPQHFPTVRDVYRTKRNVLDRLRRSQLLQRYHAPRAN